MKLLDEYHQVIAYLENFSNISLRNNFGKDKRDPNIFIDRTKYFLELLGNPQRGFRYVHVTGTAGKGTVSTMIQTVLTVSGLKTGLFTSPYVTTFIDKIQVDNKYISPRDFINLVNYLKPYVEIAKNGPYGHPSAFELSFVIALLYFKKLKCKWVVLEVGVGGRYDATNVITDPVVTVITNISYDHTEILGKTLASIAKDKMGIIKPKSAFFTSEQRPALIKLFKKSCRRLKVRFEQIKSQIDYLSYNEELVKSICTYLGISNVNINLGISQTKLPGRFEVMQKNPTVIIDGAHNLIKMESTVYNLKQLKFKKLYLILSLADDKEDRLASLSPILSFPCPIHITLTHVKDKNRRSIHPNTYLDFTRLNLKKNDILNVVENPSEALERILDRANSEDVVLVTGSFFLAGELRKYWIAEDWVLKNRKSIK